MIRRLLRAIAARMSPDYDIGRYLAEAQTPEEFAWRMEKVEKGRWYRNPYGLRYEVWW